MEKCLRIYMDLRVHNKGLNLEGMVEMGKRCTAMDLKVHSISLGMGLQAQLLVSHARPSPGMPEGAALWYLLMILGIYIDAWGGVLMGMFQYVCVHDYGI